MITPRQTRLHRVCDLRSFQQTIIDLACHIDVAAARACVVLVPSRAAAAELRQTIENRLLVDETTKRRAVVFPNLLTRAEWYGCLHERLPDSPPLLSELEREVIMSVACRDAASEAETPPFDLRPALLAEVLRLYDELRWRRQTVDHFERLLISELENQAEVDRGADRMLRQTRFLAAAFRAYERRAQASGAIDEHELRSRLIDTECARPYRQTVVTVGDHITGAGLWPADFDLLTRLPLLERIDIVSTEAELGAGFHQRLHQLLPGAEEIEHKPKVSPRCPSLLVASSDELASVSRDREEELTRLARRAKRNWRLRKDEQQGLDATAIVFKRPLPYLYIAREVFQAAGLPSQTLSALPLASEPYAAVVDLALSCASSGFTRATLVELLGSPHLAFLGQGAPVDRSSVSRLSRDLAEIGYLGDSDFLGALPQRAGITKEAAPAASAAADVALELAALTETAPVSCHLSTLIRFLQSHDRRPESADPAAARLLQARAAILGGLESLMTACAHHDDAASTLDQTAALVRCWIESQTIVIERTDAGIHLVDDGAARYGDFDEVHLVGLIQGEWPGRPPRNVFYSQFLLQKLGWPADVDWLSAERARFEDLLKLPGSFVSVSTIALEQDAIVEPSGFIEDLEGLALDRFVESEPSGRVFSYEALSEPPFVVDVQSAETSEWARLRFSRTPASDACFHGQGLPYRPGRYAVNAIETYINCPFRYFASSVLELPDEIEDEPVMSGKTRGSFIHDLLHRFYAEWGRRGRGGITRMRMEEARTLFREVMEDALATLSPSEAALERIRLAGSTAVTGILDILLRVDAERSDDVVDRLLEYDVHGDYTMAGGGVSRRVAVRGRVDRIDLVSDGTFRLFDYKSGRAPERSAAIQLPIYAFCARERLNRHGGRQWALGEASYIAFRDPQPVRPMTAKDTDAETEMAAAQATFLRAVDGISGGQFPPRPLNPFRCSFCPYSGVCRKDYVGDE